MEIAEFITKNILPILAFIVSVIGLFKGWVYRDERSFNQREKTSKFLYELYKTSEDKHLKNLSIEYGYAAITKDNHLSLEQRKALVQSHNPIQDIDAFRRCSSLLTIKSCPLSFEWKSTRHKYKIYRTMICIFNLTIYVIGCSLLILPFFYHDILPISLIKKINETNTIGQIAITSYIIFLGIFLSFINLNNIAKLKTASELRKRHVIHK